eukprot:6382914-Amphidinium_carterae.1
MNWNADIHGMGKMMHFELQGTLEWIRGALRDMLDKQNWRNKLQQNHQVCEDAPLSRALGVGRINIDQWVPAEDVCVDWL